MLLRVLLTSLAAENISAARAETDMMRLKAPVGNEPAGEPEDTAPAAVLAEAARASAQTKQLV